MDTINRLLKKQAPKRRGKISLAETTAAAGGGNDSVQNDETTSQVIEYEKPNPVYIRWISNRDGCRIGVPEEWLGSPLGRIFEGGEMSRSKVFGMSSGRMVEEVEG